MCAGACKEWMEYNLDAQFHTVHALCPSHGPPTQVLESNQNSIQSLMITGGI